MRRKATPIEIVGAWELMRPVGEIHHRDAEDAEIIDQSVFDGLDGSKMTQASGPEPEISISEVIEKMNAIEVPAGCAVCGHALDGPVFRDGEKYVCLSCVPKMRVK